jgi:UDP-N-acetylmuramate dehydrogenase
MNPLFSAIDEIRQKLPQIECRTNEPMSLHTSFRIGGTVAAMFFPKSVEETASLRRVLSENGVCPLIVGNGSNLLVEDGALDIAVIKTSGGLTEISLTGETEITAGSGLLLSQLASFALQNSLTGLEFAHGIPGTLGGAIVMNAGAYGGEMKDVVRETVSISTDGTLVRTLGEDHDFSYRHSRFSNAAELIASSVLRLGKGDSAEIRSRMEELSGKRRESQPLNLPSAGSTFKRPVGGYAAALIEQAGLKGYTVGGAMVSEKHAGFVVNAGGATFSDVMAVMDHVRHTVLQRFNIELEPEVKIIRRQQMKG